MVDSRSAVAVIIQRSRARGIVRGRGEDEVCSVDHLVRTADVQVGDVAVTSGVGGAFPPGLQVGTIVIASSPKVGVFRDAELDDLQKPFGHLEDGRNKHFDGRLSHDLCSGLYGLYSRLGCNHFG